MFDLTRRERLLIAAILFAFVTGVAVKHYRQPPPYRDTTPAPPTKNADDRI